MPFSSRPFLVGSATLAVGALLAVGSLVAVPQAAVAAGSVLVNETFTGTSVADPRFVPLGDACLTAAPRPSTPPQGGSTTPACGAHVNGSPASGTPGWLQLTDASNYRTGGVLFNQALPTAAGLQITFDQAQYGGSGADGIGFFLSDGAYDLTAPGAPGGSLGYADGNGVPGVVGGFLGIGLDAYGNYAQDSEGKGTGCPANPYTQLQPNTVTLRGPGATDDSGQWLRGYCNLGTTQAQNLRTSTSAPIRVQVTVTPIATDGSVGVSVSLSYDEGATFVPLLENVRVADAPSTVKFGFSGSTGSLTDVHLLRNVTVNTIDPLGRLSLVKQVNSSSQNYRTVYRVGDTIPYSFVVTNSGTADVTGVLLTDPKATGISCPEDTLAPAGSPGSSMTCTGSHLVTPDDVTSTSHQVQYQNTATATGTAAGVDVSATGSRAVQLGTASMSMTKTPNASSNLALGQVVNYAFTVTNTGSIPLAPVTISDPGTGLSGAACVASLAAGATATCSTTASHTITQADLLSGASYSNTATATGTLPITVTGGTVSASATATVTTVPPTASLTLSKTPSVASGVVLDQAIGYTFSVTNSGNVTLAPVVVSDPKLNLTNAPCVASLAPGATATCSTTGSHPVTNADIIAGSYQNTATATGTPPSGSGLSPATAQGQSTVTTVGAAAALGLTKTADRTTGLAAGDVVTYTFAVKNAGTVTLTDATVTDAGVGYPATVCALSLAPGHTAACSATAQHTITQADIAAGHFDNSAGATAQPPAGSGLTAPTATAGATVGTVPAQVSMVLVKTPTGTGPYAVGQTAGFSFTVTNTGNLTLAPVTITDDRAGLDGAPCVASLAPDTTATCTIGASVTVTDADVVAGAVDNVATAVGTPAVGTLDAVTARSSASTPTVDATASLEATKTASPTSVTAGQTVSYTFLVRNTGSLTLHAVSITDPLLGISGAPCVATLAPGASATCVTTGSYRTTTAGTLVNTATLTGLTPTGFADPSVSATAAAAVTVAAAVVLAATGSDPTAAVWTAVALLALGLGLRARARRRRARSNSAG